ncbi:MAG: SRPBCC family protein, partial [Actinobacteria bacterium]|nr:SRPBCC family protein [Actinomycetota bacterium]
MKLENEFTVDVPVEEVWEVLLDLERVTPCLPGAALTEESGDEYKGEMKVRLGPVTQEYSGTVKIEEADESAHRAVLKANGKDARGQGTASASITSTLHDEGNDSTRVRVETEMQITGRAAQFGRGVQQDVAEKLLTRFAECLENEIIGGGEEEPEPADTETEQSAEEEPSADGAAEEEEQPRRRIIQQDQEVEPLDLGEASQEAVLK